MSKSTVNTEPPVTYPEIYDDFIGGRDRLSELAQVLVEDEDQIDLERPEVLMALELSRMDSDCGFDSRRDLFFAILASEVAKRRGNVRFDLTDEDNELEDRLRDTLAGLPAVLGGYDLPENPEDAWQQIASGVGQLPEHLDEYSILGGPKTSTPLVVENGQLYHQKSHVQERHLAGALRERLFPSESDDTDAMAPATPEELREAFTRVLDESPFDLTGKQQYGILTAACSPLSVITGGPGTGKTSIVRSLVRLLVEVGVDPSEIALAAPTGKAANRLAESLNEDLRPEENETDARITQDLEDPATIHRLLGYSRDWQNFYYHENRPLPHQYVIVDEASMVDLNLMDQLVAAVAENANLCLLGDADQLPAVESGAVFRDLVPAEEVTTVPWRRLAPESLPEQEPENPDPLARQAVRLEENFRVKGEGIDTVNLVQVARSINRGGEDLRFREAGSSDDPHAVTVRETFEQLRFSGVEMLTAGSTSDRSWGRRFQRWYDRWYGDLLPDVQAPVPERPFSFRQGEPSGCKKELDDLFSNHNGAQLLSVTRRSALGVREINRTLHRYHRQVHDLYDRDRRFLPGEPVIMRQNDYDRQLFNGEQGLVLLVEQPSMDEPQPMAVFPGLEGYRAYHLGPLRGQLNRAYALTVHKSQGSEYGRVGLVLPGFEVPLLTRELLYTAVTRARRGVVFMGSRDSLLEGARSRDERNSGLVERLRR